MKLGDINHLNFGRFLNRHPLVLPIFPEKGARPGKFRAGGAPRRRGSLVEEFPPRELSFDLVADERFGRVTGRAGAS